MNNIYMFKDLLELPPFDNAVLDVGLANMLRLDAAARYAFSAAPYLPALKDKWQAMYQTASTGRSGIRNETETAVIHLTKSLRELNKRRKEYETLENEEDREDNVQIREMELASAEKRFTACRDKLQQLIADLQSVTLDAGQLASYLPDLKNESQTFDIHIAEIDDRISTLQSARKTLSDGMAPLEKTGFVDIAKDAMLTVESVEKLGLNPPEAELVKLAIEHMKKVLEGISKNLSYLEMYNEREEVNKRIAAENQARAQTEQKQIENGHKINLLDSILQLFSAYTSVTGELAKVSQSVEQFVQSVASNNAQGDDKETRFVASAQSLISYLEAVR